MRVIEGRRANPVNENDLHVPWQYLEGTSQEFALCAPCNHIFYHGARGPGKTDTQLMRYKRNVGRGYGSFWTGVIFDRKYKNLDDLVRKSKRWFYQYDDGAQWYSSKSDYKWVWPTGEELLIRAFENVDDYWNYHGQEFPFIGWNELCKYPNGDAYESMMSCNRSSWTQDKDSEVDELGRYLTPPIPLEVFSTANPWGPGHAWVKEKFIDAAPAGEMLEIKSEVFHPALKRNVEVTKTQIAIFGSYKENIYLSPEYIAELEGISDPNKRAAWLEGDWDVTAGGAVDDVYKKAIHVKPRFVVPSGWRVDRSMDWGSSHPCSIGWWAEANGEEATLPDGSTFCPARGSLIQIGELYYAESLTKNVGTRAGPTAIAEDIKAYEIKLMEQGWISDQPWPGPADNQIRNVTDSESDTIAQKFANCGIRWTESDKAPGARKVGLELMRERFRAAYDNPEDPSLYFMDNCLASIATIPPLPRDENDPDDVNTEAIDHPYDMVRYRVLKSANRAAKVVPIKFAR